MILKTLLLYVLCFAFHTDGYGIEFEGLIDLGPKWNYKYKISPISYQDSTVKIHLLPKYFDTLLRKDKEFENEKQQKLRIREWQKTKSPQENNSSEKYITRIYDSETSKENGDIKRSKSMVQTTETRNRHNKIQHYTSSPLFTFHGQLNDENDPKVSQTRVKNNLRATSGFLPNEKKYAQKSHKNKKRNRIHKNITNQDYKVKDDPKIFSFTLHIFQQNLKIFDNIMKSAQLDRLKHKFKSVKKRYIEEFKNFLSQNKDYKIKTKLGIQKVIFNTIDTCYKILQRLIPQVSKAMDGENFVKDNPIKKFQRGVDRQKIIEEIHACKKFGMCRNKEEYSDFITEIIGFIIQANDSKVKQASDALTEVVKTTDFTNVIDNNIQDEVRKFMKVLEVSDPVLLRAMFFILRNAISSQNHPIVIIDPVDEKLAAKTTAFHNILNILDKNIVKSANDTEWDEIIRHFEEWKDGFRTDILNLFETLTKQIKMAFDKMDSKTAQQVNENMKILVKPLKYKTARINSTKNPYHEIL
ncbi:uncharacterized protein LOC123879564 isoform X2 [Maniola jurtina]|uniref:uncharacterized protein LOC123879564 isoform X2 n=1 Tax=Maniola jurtina TaxID=191418 RepID=UPI001E68AB5C|nr:uncharacterized protein LOC123879564 isoform X2 [Maniola jurtina]